MFKDLLVIDNILNSPDKLVKLSRKIIYDENKINQNIIETNIPISNNRTFGSGERHWCGFRSDFLYNLNVELFNDTFDEIFSKIFSHYKFSAFNYYVDAHLHFLPECCVCSDKNFHRDTSDINNVIMAGVIYLNENPGSDSGTILMINEKENHIVENKFNRLVIYNSHILHRPQNGFGSKIDDCRLTLTFFVKKIEIIS
jgi:hypothetical protein